MTRFHTPPKEHDAIFAPILAEIEEELRAIRRVPAMRGIDDVVAQFSWWSEASSSLRFDSVGPTAYRITEESLSRYGGQAMSIQAASNCARAAGHIRQLFASRSPGTRAADALGASEIDLLNDLHFLAMSGLVRSGEIGRLRRGEMEILDPVTGRVVAEGTRAGELDDALATWSKEFRAEAWKGRHPLLRSGYAHLAFERHHPYVDGNGRVGRLVMEAMHAEDGLPALGLTRVFENQRRGYVTTIAKGSAKSDPESWMESYLEMSLIAARALPAVRRALRSSMTEMARGLMAADFEKKQANTVAATFITMPFATVPMAARRANIEERQMREAIYQLEKRSMLTEAKLGDVRLFIARDPIQLLCTPVALQAARPSGHKELNDARLAATSPVIADKAVVGTLPAAGTKPRSSDEPER